MPDPTGATPPLDEDERARLARFVAAIAAGGRSALLITSRTPEGWLGDSIARLPVGGLNRDEAVQYADVLLSGLPASRARRARPAFGRLLDALDGHPLSMRLVLPHVATTDPEGLLDALRGRGELPTGHGKGRLASLQSCVGYSFDHLDLDMRRCLVVLSLFQGVVDAYVLDLLSSRAVPERFGNLEREDWVRALDAAAAVGLLTVLAPANYGMYGIHPALPDYLAAMWQHDSKGSYRQERAATSRALIRAYAGFCEWLGELFDTDGVPTALHIIDLQSRSLGELLVRGPRSSVH